MNINILYDNYLKSLNQKYNAVCFDIDGTLTCKDSKKIDKRAIDMIIELLLKKVPVVFITGRGETGLNDLKNDIYDTVISDDRLCAEDLKRIYVLTNDGARIFYSIGLSKSNFLSENSYISTKEEMSQLKIVDNMIKTMKNNNKFEKYFDITYSKDSMTNIILNIRIVFNIDNYEIINKIFCSIEKYIKKYNLNSVHLSRGLYKGKSVIQLGTATKDKAIERTEELIGVPRDSMIRIGDCGDLRGNDYFMLNCNQGYSVDKVSGSINSCFPVFDDNKSILKGVDGTLYLIKRAKILPTICLEKIEKDIYKYHFSRIEKDIVVGRKNILKKYNNIVSSNFYNCNCIDDLFDKRSGSIMIPLYEMEIISNSPLKELWLSSVNEKLNYSLKDDSNYLLRGSRTYYYFLAHRKSINEVDITSKNDVIKWYNNYIRFLVDAVSAIDNTKNLDDSSNKKLLLGILDNCRNINLLLINHYLVMNYPESNVLLDISNQKDTNILKLYSTIMKIEKLICKICFERQFIINKNSIINCVKETQNILVSYLTMELKREEKDNYSKDYRAYREIDNFAENYIAVSLYRENCNDIEHVNACGLSYGGIELPMLSKIIDKNKIEKQLILKFNKEVSGYANKQLLDLRKFDIHAFGGLSGIDELKNSNIDLFDDNVLTGKTLQLAINSLYDYGITTKNVCIVRYPSINRTEQMFLDNPSAVDYNLFFNYIYGLCFSSPYSLKDDDWKKSDGTIDYTDSLGVFDLNRKKIIECLLKNHEYDSKSEVGEYKRRLIK